MNQIVKDLRARIITLEGAFEYGKISRLERDVEYLQKHQTDQARTITALCALAGISSYDLQPVNRGSE